MQVRKIYFAAMMALMVMVFTNCNSANNDSTATEGNQIESTETNGGEVLKVDDFESKYKKTANAQLVDVRTADEYSKGHLANAVNIDVKSSEFENGLNKLDKSKPTFIYCLSGNRSKTAASKMRELGFTQIYELDGGILAWQNANKNLVTEVSAEKVGFTEADLQAAINENDIVLVDYNATWCGPCKILSPILDNIVEENKGKFKFLSVDVDESRELAMKMKIVNIPTMMIYKKGEMTWQYVGLTNKENIVKALGI